jgi:NADPH-dependent ferric siderophore reductase
VKVGPFTFRDYTPTGWDADTRTCTLYIDAAHDGPGAVWVKNLQPGDAIVYLGIAPTLQSLLPDAKAVFLGDQSALGHFLALMQAAGKQADIEGAIVLPEKAHRSQYGDYIVQLPLDTLPVKRTLADSIIPWLSGKLFPEESIFYLVGNAQLVTTTRSALKQKGIGPKQIKAQGFWH